MKLSDDELDLFLGEIKFLINVRSGMIEDENEKESPSEKIINYHQSRSTLLEKVLTVLNDEKELSEHLEEKIKHLYHILDLYKELGNKAKAYDFRFKGIELQIDSLEELRDGDKDNWMKCYNEDVREIKNNNP